VIVARSWGSGPTLGGRGRWGERRIRGSGRPDCGDNHARFALIENEERTRQALRGIKAMLAKGVVPA